MGGTARSPAVNTRPIEAHERLRREIARQEDLLGGGVLSDREAAVVALLRAQDRRQHVPASEPLPDLVTGRRVAGLGVNKALLLVLQSGRDDATQIVPFPGGGLDDWAGRFLGEGDRLAGAELVLAHCETGFMRLVDEGDGTFAAWIATKRAPTSWHERADISWWAAWLAKQHEPEWRGLSAGQEMARESGEDGCYLRLADNQLRTMAYQLGYPADATLGGCTIQTYRDVLGRLIAGAVRARDRGESVAAQSARALIAALAADLAVDPDLIERAVAAFTLDRTGAAYHAAVPGVAAAPLVRVAPDRLVWSVRGLTTEPLLFLTRELRRRDAEGYHNTAHLREAVFRQDLYALFADRRFVTSAARIVLRRDQGEARTDIDAAVFDRKTGTLGLFELKSQDPFARSTAELARQRDNVLYANRQLSGILAWVQRHGADDLLGRMDARTARTFRVQKVYPFVLGRYLVHFNDGPEPDHRAAWGTWPQVLRLLDGQSGRAGGANPIASLFTRLRADAPIIQPPADAPPLEIATGDVRLAVYPSYAAFRASVAGGRAALTPQPPSPNPGRGGH